MKKKQYRIKWFTNKNFLHENSKSIGKKPAVNNFKTFPVLQDVLNLRMKLFSLQDYDDNIFKPIWLLTLQNTVKKIYDMKYILNSFILIP